MAASIPQLYGPLRANGPRPDPAGASAGEPLARAWAATAGPRVPLADPPAGPQAVERAVAAGRDWSRLPVAARADTLRGKPALAPAAAALGLAEAASVAGPVGDLKARVEANPGDHQARFDLATALHAVGEREAAAEALLEIVRRNRAWNEEAARKELVKYFEAWGPTDPLTLQTRRQLSTLLFS